MAMLTPPFWSVSRSISLPLTKDYVSNRENLLSTSLYERFSGYDGSICQLASPSTGACRLPCSWPLWSSSAS